MLKAYIVNYYKNCFSFVYLQPYENFIACVFGITNLIFANGFYFINTSYSYEYNSYLLINNLYSLYLLSSLDDLIFCYKNDLGQSYLANKHLEQQNKNKILFKKLKEEVLKNRSKNLKNLLKSKANISNDLDLILVLLALLTLLISFLFDSIFAIFLSLYVFKIYKANFFCFYSIKSQRFISSLFLGLFMFFIYNTKYYNLYYINHLVAVNDERFILAIKLLIKLILTVVTIICFFFSKDFFFIFNFYNYTSYKYVEEEGINEQKVDSSKMSSSKINSSNSNKLNSFSFAASSDNILDYNNCNGTNRNESGKLKFFENSGADFNAINGINKINFGNSSIFNSESYESEFGLFTNPVFDYGINQIKNINIDIGGGNNSIVNSAHLNKNQSLNNNSNNTSNAYNSNCKNKNISNNNQHKTNNSNNINSYSNSNSTSFTNIQNSSYNNYIGEKSGESISQYARKIKEIYNLNNSLDEIFCFSIEKSTSYINSILETINFNNNNNSSKIDSVYIEFLITKSTKHVYLLGIFLDYFLLYCNFWLANFTIEEVNQNNYLFSALLQAAKFGILLKLFFVIFEYSKSRTQIITIIILNSIFLNRLVTYNEANIIDYYTLTLLINLNKVIYLYFIENSYLVNLVIFIFSFIEYRRNKEIFLLCFLACCLCFKTIFAYSRRTLTYKRLGFMVFGIVFILLFMFIQQETIDYLYEYLQESLIWYLKIDVIGIFEYISFNSITIPSKYFGKDKSNFVYIQRSSFFEELCAREILKYFIRYKIIKM